LRGESEGGIVTDAMRLKLLRIALLVSGVVCIALYPLMIVWPSGWTWHTGHSDYPMMIVGIYATLGVFLIRAARDPMANLSLIGFAVWSSAVHGAIMAVQAMGNEMHRGHLIGDVPALLVAAAVLGWLMPRRA
jgi:hypothetical protein